MSHPLFCRIVSDNDQDLAACEQWWREASDNAKMQVLHCITRKYDDPAMEVMSRFAQLAFGQMAEREAAKRT